MDQDRKHDSVVNGMSGVKSAMTDRWTVRAMGIGALLFCALGSCLGQTHPEPYAFFRQYIRLK